MDIKEFMKELKATLASAVDGLPEKPEDAKPEDLTKAIAGVKTAVETVTKALTSEEGDDQSPLIKVIEELREDSKTYREVLEKMAERLETLEKGTAVRKGLSGQEGDGEGDGKPKEKVEKSGTMALAFSSLMKNGKVTLT